jgi:hypothetical protein
VPDTDRELQRIGAELADAVIAAVPGWICKCVEVRFDDWARRTGGPPYDEQPSLADLALQAGVDAARQVEPGLRSLLSADVDAQSTTPLTLVRPLVARAGDVLEMLGVPPVERDDFERARFPDDRYGLVPASLSALGDEVGELALVWGAAKAIAHRGRHAS